MSKDPGTIRILVYSPQLIENYKLKSGEGVSVPFVVIWLVGDILILLGALIANLLPTVILLAVWVRLDLASDKRSPDVDTVHDM